VERGHLSAPNALPHKAVPGRTVQRFALSAYCFARAGVPLAFLDEAHLSSAKVGFWL
jgi:hypothetical protein